MVIYYTMYSWYIFYYYFVGIMIIETKFCTFNRDSVDLVPLSKDCVMKSIRQTLHCKCPFNVVLIAKRGQTLCERYVAHSVSAVFVFTSHNMKYCGLTAILKQLHVL